MNFRQRLLSVFGRKENAAMAAVSLRYMGRPVHTPANYEALAREGFQKNVIAYRAILGIATAGAGVPLLMYKKGTGKRSRRLQEIEESPILDLLRRPNPLQGGATFQESALGFYLLAGNTYLNAVGPGPGAPPKELWVIRPDRMKVIPGMGGMPAAYEFKEGDAAVRYPVDLFKGTSPILHMKSFNPTNPWYGMAPLEAAARSVDEHNAAGDFNLALLQNQAMPSGALKVEVSDKNPTGSLNDKQFENLKNELRSTKQGAKNAGEVMILEGGMSWQSFSFDPEQMKLIESKFASAREVAIALGYPPMLLGIPGDNTYSNYKEAKAALYEDAALPVLDRYCGDLTRWLLPDTSDGFLAPDRDSIDALADRRQAVWDQTSKADWLTVNEKREKVGYEPVKGGDVIMVSAAMIPLEQAVAEPEPDPNTDPSADPDGDEEQGDDEGDEKPDESDDGDEEEDEEEDAAGKGMGLSIKGPAVRLAADRTREWRASIKLRAGLERRFSRQVAAVFKAERDRVLDAVQGLDSGSAEHAALDEIDSGRKAWESALRSNATTAATMFGERVLRALKSLPNDAELKADSAIRFRDLMTDWAEDHVAEHVKGILATSRETVRKKIRQAFIENEGAGDGQVELAKAIRETYDGFTSSRAMGIAITETTAASTAGSELAAKAAGIPGLEKEWISAEDGRERDDHAKANGQRVPIDGLFKVGDAMMPRPGDGPANQVVRCRCTLGFVRG